MDRCVIHVGMPKTGTSSIQKSLNGFEDDRFVYYRDHRGRTNHTAEIFEVLGLATPRQAARGDRGAPHERIPVNPDSRKSLEDAVRSLNGRTLIVSGEGLPMLPREALRELASYLHGLGLEVEIVGYVRTLVGFVTSLARASKGGSLVSLNLARKFFTYRGRFEKFDEVFGRENVRLWKFDPSSFRDGCVVRDFCGKIGLTIPPDRIVRVNESLSREVVELLYIYRKFGADLGSEDMKPQQRYRLIQKLSGIGESKFHFAPDLLRPMLKHNEADIEWMESRIGQSLRDDVPEPKPDDVRTEADLFRRNPAVVDELLRRLGSKAPSGVEGGTPKEVASLVHALRDDTRRGLRGWRLRRGGARRPGGRVLAQSPQEGA